MAKGICLIQSNKTNNYNANSFIYFYLVRVGSGLPGYISSLSPPVPGGICEGVGVQGSAACDQNFVMYPPPLCDGVQGVQSGGLKTYTSFCSPPKHQEGTSWDLAGEAEDDTTENVQVLTPIFQVMNVVLLPPASA